MSRRIKVGTRASKLARFQTEILISYLSARDPGVSFETVLVTTSGDKVRDRPISEVGDVGVFVKELEEALIKEEVDIVSHSLKDLPTDLPPALFLGCVLDREDPRDIMVSSGNIKFKDLPAKATVATSSRRRTAQLSALRQDLRFVDIRGNVPTRLKKHDEGQCDAIILAAAGLKRLGLIDRVSEYLDVDVCVPAPGQGALAAECRADDQMIVKLLASADNPDVRAEITAEREFLKALGGGCSVPIGALGRISGDSLALTGCVAALDGSKILKRQLSGRLVNPEEVGQRLAQLLIDSGAATILSQLRLSAPKAISPP
jgi:hydroxymethylbilane synthase